MREIPVRKHARRLRSGITSVRRHLRSIRGRARLPKILTEPSTLQKVGIAAAAMGTVLKFVDKKAIGRAVGQRIAEKTPLVGLYVDLDELKIRPPPKGSMIIRKPDGKYISYIKEGLSPEQSIYEMQINGDVPIGSEVYTKDAKGWTLIARKLPQEEYLKEVANRGNADILKKLAMGRSEELRGFFHSKDDREFARALYKYVSAPDTLSFDEHMSLLERNYFVDKELAINAAKRENISPGRFEAEWTKAIGYKREADKYGQGWGRYASTSPHPALAGQTALPPKKGETVYATPPPRRQEDVLVVPAGVSSEAVWQQHLRDIEAQRRIVATVRGGDVEGAESRPNYFPPGDEEIEDATQYIANYVVHSTTGEELSDEKRLRSAERIVREHIHHRDYGPIYHAAKQWRTM